MDQLSDVLRTAHRFYDLAAQCRAEADYLAEHYRAGHVAASAFDEISLLTSAALRADRAGDALVHDGADENELDEADVVTEEIERLVRAIRPWRVLLDNVHRHRRSHDAPGP